jgi:hypothetical protein
LISLAKEDVLKRGSRRSVLKPRRFQARGRAFARILVGFCSDRVSVDSVEVHPPLRRMTPLRAARHVLTRDVLGIFGVESRFNELIASGLDL